MHKFIHYYPLQIPAIGSKIGNRKENMQKTMVKNPVDVGDWSESELDAALRTRFAIVDADIKAGKNFKTALSSYL